MFTIWTLISMQIGLCPERQKYWFEECIDQPDACFLKEKVIKNAFEWSRAAQIKQKYQIS